MISVASGLMWMIVLWRLSARGDTFFSYMEAFGKTVDEVSDAELVLLYGISTIYVFEVKGR